MLPSLLPHFLPMRCLSVLRPRLINRCMLLPIGSEPIRSILVPRITGILYRASRRRWLGSSAIRICERMTAIMFLSRSMVLPVPQPAIFLPPIYVHSVPTSPDLLIMLFTAQFLCSCSRKFIDIW